MTTSRARSSKSPLFIIFTTVFIDLIGFGMVIPLIGLYGRHFGADGLELPILGAIYSLMQFFFAPFWGSLSDRIGRRPVLLISLTGSTLAYLMFGLASSYTWLLLGRAFGGICAANISTAQAYIADITTPKDRAKGMGLIGAAFGIGFTLGPPLGGIAAAKIGIAAPGLIASAICGLNLIFAFFRLPESLPPSARRDSGKEKGNEKAKASPIWATFGSLGKTVRQLSSLSNYPNLAFYLMTFFFVTFAFSTMEQTFSLLFQAKFNLETGDAGYKTGLVLMTSGLLGAVIQGGMIRSLVQRYGEKKLLVAGLMFNALMMGLFPYTPTYGLYFLMAVPIAIGSGLINPSLSALISKSVGSQEQGSTMGLSQGLGSLARAIGPFFGLYTFAIQPEIPYLVASFVTFMLIFFTLKKFNLKSK